MANNLNLNCKECGGKLIQAFEGELSDPDMEGIMYNCQKCGVETEIEQTVHELRTGLGSVKGSIPLVGDPKSWLNTTDFVGKGVKPITKIRGLELGTDTETRRKYEQLQKIDNYLQKDFYWKSLPKITESVKLQIKQLASHAIKNKKNLNAKNLLGVCTYVVLRRNEIPISFKQISKSFQIIDEKIAVHSTDSLTQKKMKLKIQKEELKKIENSISSLYNKLKLPEIDELGNFEAIITKTSPINPISCITGANLVKSRVSDISVPKVIKQSNEIFHKLKENQMVAGKNPLGIAAALVYSSMQLLHLRPTQARIAHAFGVSDLTVRNNAKMIDTILERNLA